MIDYQVVLDERTGQEVLEVPLTGTTLLECPMFNKGSAFPEEERSAFQLRGLLPPHVNTLEMQLARRYEEYGQKSSNLERHIYLRALQDRNETLFYRLLYQHITEMMPIIYTPVVGEACQYFSHIYRRPRGLFISYPQKNEIDAILDNRPFAEVDVIVVTDGERILGLGDQGLGGMGIPVGKLSLYTLCGGIHPARTLPVFLDVGTDNRDRLDDPIYLGWRHERIRGAEYDEFIEAFVHAVMRKLPGVLLQWEDFAQRNARRLLDRYRDRLCTFNDDIQGTAAVTLAAVLAALHVTQGKLTDQRVVILGAGSAGTGIAEQLVSAMTRMGLSPLEALSRFWLVDRQGLIHSGMSDLDSLQRKFTQPIEQTANWRKDSAGSISLADVVRNVRPTILIGACGHPGTFTEPVIREMAQHVERPIVFPLSNPISRCEATPGDLLKWTGARALIATGSPFSTMDFEARTVAIGQCNNSYIFPGMGLGVITSGARRVTDDMFLAAARALSDCSPVRRDPVAPLLPPLENIRHVSRRIALAVGAEAQHEGLAEKTSHEELALRINSHRWQPTYRPMRLKK
jgi:malate dehydrogenase (oxaloacetate-decarboxylating)